jgi:hypothetical protein
MNDGTAITDTVWPAETQCDNMEFTCRGHKGLSLNAEWLLFSRFNQNVYAWQKFRSLQHANVKFRQNPFMRAQTVTWGQNNTVKGQNR